MQLEVTPAAAKQVQKQFQLTSGAKVRLAPANGPHHGPHQKIIPVSTLQSVVAATKVNGITFVVSYDDEWFFSGLITTLDCQPDRGLFFTFVDHHGQNPDAVSGASNQYEWMWY